MKTFGSETRPLLNTSRLAKFLVTDFLSTTGQLRALTALTWNREPNDDGTDDYVDSDEDGDVPSQVQAQPWRQPSCEHQTQNRSHRQSQSSQQFQQQLAQPVAVTSSKLLECVTDLLGASLDSWNAYPFPCSVLEKLLLSASENAALKKDYARQLEVRNSKYQQELEARLYAEAEEEVSSC